MNVQSPGGRAAAVYTAAPDGVVAGSTSKKQPEWAAPEYVWQQLPQQESHMMQQHQLSMDQQQLRLQRQQQMRAQRHQQQQHDFVLHNQVQQGGGLSSSSSSTGSVGREEEERRKNSFFFVAVDQPPHQNYAGDNTAVTAAALPSQRAFHVGSQQHGFSYYWPPSSQYTGAKPQEQQPQLAQQQHLQQQQYEHPHRSYEQDQQQHLQQQLQLQQQQQMESSMQEFSPSQHQQSGLYSKEMWMRQQMLDNKSMPVADSSSSGDRETPRAVYSADGRIEEGPHRMIAAAVPPYAEEDYHNIHPSAYEGGQQQRQFQQQMLRDMREIRSLEGEENKQRQHQQQSEQQTEQYNTTPPEAAARRGDAAAATGVSASEDAAAAERSVTKRRPVPWGGSHEGTSNSSSNSNRDGVDTGVLPAGGSHFFRSSDSDDNGGRKEGEKAESVSRFEVRGDGPVTGHGVSGVMTPETGGEEGDPTGVMACVSECPRMHHIPERDREPFFSCNVASAAGSSEGRGPPQQRPQKRLMGICAGSSTTKSIATEQRSSSTSRMLSVRGNNNSRREEEGERYQSRDTAAVTECGGRGSVFREQEKRSNNCSSMVTALAAAQAREGAATRGSSAICSMKDASDTEEAVPATDAGAGETPAGETAAKAGDTTAATGEGSGGEAAEAAGGALTDTGGDSGGGSGSGGGGNSGGVIGRRYAFREKRQKRERFEPDIAAKKSYTAVPTGFQLSSDSLPVEQLEGLQLFVYRKKPRGTWKKREQEMLLRQQQQQESQQQQQQHEAQQQGQQEEGSTAAAQNVEMQHPPQQQQQPLVEKSGSSGCAAAVAAIGTATITSCLNATGATAIRGITTGETSKHEGGEGGGMKNVGQQIQRRPQPQTDMNTDSISSRIDDAPGTSAAAAAARAFKRIGGGGSAGGVAVRSSHNSGAQHTTGDGVYSHDAAAGLAAKTAAESPLYTYASIPAPPIGGTKGNITAETSSSCVLQEQHRRFMCLGGGEQQQRQQLRPAHPITTAPGNAGATAGATAGSTRRAPPFAAVGGPNNLTQVPAPVDLPGGEGMSHQLQQQHQLQQHQLQQQRLLEQQQLREQQQYFQQQHHLQQHPHLQHPHVQPQQHQKQQQPQVQQQRKVGGGAISQDIYRTNSNGGGGACAIQVDQSRDGRAAEVYDSAAVGARVAAIVGGDISRGSANSGSQQHCAALEGVTMYGDMFSASLNNATDPFFYSSNSSNNTGIYRWWVDDTPAAAAGGRGQEPRLYSSPHALGSTAAAGAAASWYGAVVAADADSMFNSGFLEEVEDPGGVCSGSGSFSTCSSGSVISGKVKRKGETPAATTATAVGKEKDTGVTAATGSSKKEEAAVTGKATREKQSGTSSSSATTEAATWLREQLATNPTAVEQFAPFGFYYCERLVEDEALLLQQEKEQQARYLAAKKAFQEHMVHAIKWKQQQRKVEGQQQQQQSSLGDAKSEYTKEMDISQYTRSGSQEKKITDSATGDTSQAAACTAAASRDAAPPSVQEISTEKKVREDREQRIATGKEKKGRVEGGDPCLLGSSNSRRLAESSNSSCRSVSPSPMCTPKIAFKFSGVRVTDSESSSAAAGTENLATADDEDVIGKDAADAFVPDAASCAVAAAPEGNSDAEGVRPAHAEAASSSGAMTRVKEGDSSSLFLSSFQQQSTDTLTTSGEELAGADAPCAAPKKEKQQQQTERLEGIFGVLSTAAGKGEGGAVDSKDLERNSQKKEFSESAAGASCGGYFSGLQTSAATAAGKNATGEEEASGCSSSQSAEETQESSSSNNNVLSKPGAAPTGGGGGAAAKGGAAGASSVRGRWTGGRGRGRGGARRAAAAAAAARRRTAAATAAGFAASSPSATALGCSMSSETATTAAADDAKDHEDLHRVHNEASKGIPFDFSRGDSSSRKIEVSETSCRNTDLFAWADKCCNSSSNSKCTNGSTDSCIVNSGKCMHSTCNKRSEILPFPSEACTAEGAWMEVLHRATTSSTYDDDDAAFDFESRRAASRKLRESASQLFRVVAALAADRPFVNSLASVATTSRASSSTNSSKPCGWEEGKAAEDLVVSAAPFPAGRQKEEAANSGSASAAGPPSCIYTRDSAAAVYSGESSEQQQRLQQQQQQHHSQQQQQQPVNSIGGDNTPSSANKGEESHVTLEEENAAAAAECVHRKKQQQEGKENSSTSAVAITEVAATVPDPVSLESQARTLSFSAAGGEKNSFLPSIASAEASNAVAVNKKEELVRPKEPASSPRNSSSSIKKKRKENSSSNTMNPLLATFLRRNGYASVAAAAETATHGGSTETTHLSRSQQGILCGVSSTRNGGSHSSTNRKTSYDVLSGGSLRTAVQRQENRLSPAMQAFSSSLTAALLDLPPLTVLAGICPRILASPAALGNFVFNTNSHILPATTLKSRKKHEKHEHSIAVTPYSTTTTAEGSSSSSLSSFCVSPSVSSVSVYNIPDRSRRSSNSSCHGHQQNNTTTLAAAFFAAAPPERRPANHKNSNLARAAAAATTTSAQSCNHSNSINSRRLMTAEKSGGRGHIVSSGVCTALQFELRRLSAATPSRSSCGTTSSSQKRDQRSKEQQLEGGDEGNLKSRYSNSVRGSSRNINNRHSGKEMTGLSTNTAGGGISDATTTNSHVNVSRSNKGTATAVRGSATTPAGGSGAADNAATAAARTATARGPAAEASSSSQQQLRNNNKKRRGGNDTGTPVTKSSNSSNKRETAGGSSFSRDSSSFALHSKNRRGGEGPLKEDARAVTTPAGDDGSSSSGDRLRQEDNEKEERQAFPSSSASCINSECGEIARRKRINRWIREDNRRSKRLRRRLQKTDKEELFYFDRNTFAHIPASLYSLWKTAMSTQVYYRHPAFSVYRPKLGLLKKFFPAAWSAAHNPPATRHVTTAAAAGDVLAAVRSLGVRVDIETLAPPEKLLLHHFDVSQPWRCLRRLACKAVEKRKARLQKEQQQQYQQQALYVPPSDDLEAVRCYYKDAPDQSCCNSSNREERELTDSGAAGATNTALEAEQQKRTGNERSEKFQICRRGGNRERRGGRSNNIWGWSSSSGDDSMTEGRSSSSSSEESEVEGETSNGNKQTNKTSSTTGTFEAEHPESSAPATRAAGGGTEGSSSRMGGKMRISGDAADAGCNSLEEETGNSSQQTKNSSGVEEMLNQDESLAPFPTYSAAAAAKLLSPNCVEGAAAAAAIVGVLPLLSLSDQKSSEGGAGGGRDSRETGSTITGGPMMYLHSGNGNSGNSAVGGGAGVSSSASLSLASGNSTVGSLQQQRNSSSNNFLLSSSSRAAAAAQSAHLLRWRAVLQLRQEEKWLLSPPPLPLRPHILSADLQIAAAALQQGRGCYVVPAKEIHWHRVDALLDHWTALAAVSSPPGSRAGAAAGVSAVSVKSETTAAGQQQSEQQPQQHRCSSSREMQQQGEGYTAAAETQSAEFVAPAALGGGGGKGKIAEGDESRRVAGSGDIHKADMLQQLQQQEQQQEEEEAITALQLLPRLPALPDAWHLVPSQQEKRRRAALLQQQHAATAAAARAAAAAASGRECVGPSSSPHNATLEADGKIGSMGIATKSAIATNMCNRKAGGGGAAAAPSEAGDPLGTSVLGGNNVQSQTTSTPGSLSTGGTGGSVGSLQQQQLHQHQQQPSMSLQRLQRDAANNPEVEHDIWQLLQWRWRKEGTPVAAVVAANLASSPTPGFRTAAAAVAAARHTTSLGSSVSSTSGASAASGISSVAPSSPAHYNSEQQQLSLSGANLASSSLTTVGAGAGGGSLSAAGEGAVGLLSETPNATRGSSSDTSTEYAFSQGVPCPPHPTATTTAGTYLSNVSTPGISYGAATLPSGATAPPPQVVANVSSTAAAARHPPTYYGSSSRREEHNATHQQQQMLHQQMLQQQMIMQHQQSVPPPPLQQLGRQQQPVPVHAAGGAESFIGTWEGMGGDFQQQRGGTALQQQLQRSLPPCQPQQQQRPSPLISVTAIAQQQQLEETQSQTAAPVAPPATAPGPVRSPDSTEPFEAEDHRSCISVATTAASSAGRMGVLTAAGSGAAAGGTVMSRGTAAAGGRKYGIGVKPAGVGPGGVLADASTVESRETQQPQHGAVATYDDGFCFSGSSSSSCGAYGRSDGRRPSIVAAAPFAAAGSIPSENFATDGAPCFPSDRVLGEKVEVCERGGGPRGQTETQPMPERPIPFDATAAGTRGGAAAGATASSPSDEQQQQPVMSSGGKKGPPVMSAYKADAPAMVAAAPTAQQQQLQEQQQHLKHQQPHLQQQQHPMYNTPPYGSQLPQQQPPMYGYMPPLPQQQQAPIPASPPGISHPSLSEEEPGYFVSQPIAAAGPLQQSQQQDGYGQALQPTGYPSQEQDYGNTGASSLTAAGEVAVEPRPADDSCTGPVGYGFGPQQLQRQLFSLQQQQFTLPSQQQHQPTFLPQQPATGYESQQPHHQYCSVSQPPYPQQQLSGATYPPHQQRGYGPTQHFNPSGPLGGDTSGGGSAVYAGGGGGPAGNPEVGYEPMAYQEEKERVILPGLGGTDYMQQGTGGPPASTSRVTNSGDMLAPPPPPGSAAEAAAAAAAAASGPPGAPPLHCLKRLLKFYPLSVLAQRLGVHRSTVARWAKIWQRQQQEEDQTAGDEKGRTEEESGGAETPQPGEDERTSGSNTRSTGSTSSSNSTNKRPLAGKTEKSNKEALAGGGGGGSGKGALPPQQHMASAPTDSSGTGAGGSSSSRRRAAHNSGSRAGSNKRGNEDSRSRKNSDSEALSPVAAT